MKVNRSVTVNASPEKAFRVFVEDIGTWWPLSEGFAFAGDKWKDMILEGREGGRLFERSRDGQEFHIGTVRVYDPPNRVVFSWGEDTEEWEGPTEVEVRFSPQGEVTRVELEHRGFDRIGPSADETRNTYAGGWVAVLGRYEQHVA
jgi:uncharacterized protein YndB with AHSA1/START domain